MGGVLGLGAGRAVNVLLLDADWNCPSPNIPEAVGILCGVILSYYIGKANRE